MLTEFGLASYAALKKSESGTSTDDNPFMREEDGSLSMRWDSLEVRTKFGRPPGYRISYFWKGQRIKDETVDCLSHQVFTLSGFLAKQNVRMETPDEDQR